MSDDILGAAAPILGAVAPFLPPPFNVIAAVGAFAIGAFAASQAGKESSTFVSNFEREAQLNTITIRSSDEAHRTVFGTARVGSILNYGTSKGPSNKTLQLVVDFGSGPWHAFKKIYYNDDVIDVASDIAADGRVIGSKYAAAGHYIRLHLGATDQLADDRAVAELAGWDADCRNRGVAYAYIEIPFDQKRYPNGLPDISVEVEGVPDIYDPRDQQTRFTNNPALVIRHYLLDQVYGMKVDASEIDEDSFIAAANVCDELVPLSSGGTQKRYTLDGVMRYGDREHMSVMEELLTAMGGLLTWTEFKYKLYAAAYRPPALSLDEKALAGDVDWQQYRPWQELYNRVQGKFVDESRADQLQDFPPVDVPGALADDGRPKVRNIQLPYTKDATRAQRIAKIHGLKSRQGRMLWPGNMRSIAAPIGEPIRITYPDLGMTDRVLVPLRYVSDPAAGIEITLEGDGPEVYAWDPGDAKTIPANEEAAPDNPAPIVANLSATQTGPDKVTVVWQEVDPRPFAYTLKYGAVSSDPKDAILIDNFERGTQVVTAQIPPAPDPWVIWLWTNDEYGVESETPASTQIKVDNFLDIIEGTPEAPPWPGSGSGWLKHWTGVLVPETTVLAADMTDEDLWDKYSAHPVPSSVYEIQERDRGFDAAGVRVYGNISSRLGPGETQGQSTPVFEIDYRLAAELYDGFEIWTLGIIDYRFLKARVTQDNTAGLIVLENLTVVEDVAEQTLRVKDQDVAQGGQTVLFPQRFHAPPNVGTTPHPGPGGALRHAKVSNITEIGFDCVIVDSTDTDTGGTTDYTATGALGRVAGQQGQAA